MALGVPTLGRAVHPGFQFALKALDAVERNAILLRDLPDLYARLEALVTNPAEWRFLRKLGLRAGAPFHPDCTAWLYRRTILAARALHHGVKETKDEQSSPSPPHCSMSDSSPPVRPKDCAASATKGQAPI
jgi:hypothetical protein